MSKNIKVFISWSGKESNSVAKVIKEWLEELLAPIDIFTSSEIPSGKQWFNVLSDELKSSNFGIICLTPDNINSNWMHFEAGAIFNAFNNEGVIPFLFAITIDELPSPLNQFQGITYKKSNLLKIAKDLNKLKGITKVEETILTKRFERSWQDLKSKLDPLHEKALKKLIWIFETKDAEAEEAINKARELNFSVKHKWILPDGDPPTDYSGCRGFVYVYKGSDAKKSRLEQMIDFLETIQPRPNLLIYSPSMIPAEECEIIKRLYSNPLYVNSPERLKVNLESF